MTPLQRRIVTAPRSVLGAPLPPDVVSRFSSSSEELIACIFLELLALVFWLRFFTTRSPICPNYRFLGNCFSSTTCTLNNEVPFFYVTCGETINRVTFDALHFSIPNESRCRALHKSRNVKIAVFVVFCARSERTQRTIVGKRRRHTWYGFTGLGGVKIHDSWRVTRYS